MHRGVLVLATSQHSCPDTSDEPSGQARGAKNIALELSRRGILIASPHFQRSRNTLPRKMATVLTLMCSSSTTRRIGCIGCSSLVTSRVEDRQWRTAWRGFAGLPRCLPFAEHIRVHRQTRPGVLGSRHIVEKRTPSLPPVLCGMPCVPKRSMRVRPKDSLACEKCWNLQVLRSCMVEVGVA